MLDLFGYHFVQLAVLAVLVLAGIHAYLGYHVVSRGVIFVDLSLAQVSALGATIAEMGMVLFGLSIGSMVGILGSGWLVKRLGTRDVARIGLWLVVTALLTIGLGVTVAMAPIVGLGLGLFGLGMGSAEIAINMEGADVERLTGTHLLHALHGFFSLGTVCGALMGIVFTQIDFPVAWHLAIVALISVLPILMLMKHIPPGFGRDAHEVQAGVALDTAPVWKDFRLYLIGMVVLAMALAEGAANDWLPLLMVDEFDFSPTSGSLIFLGFATAMTIGRFGGGWFLKRFGRQQVLFGSALIGAAGLATVVFASSPIAAAAAVFLWGLGASLGFPVALSLAGDSGPNPAERVKLVAISGYVAFLVGPPLLGFVGEHYGLRNAMIIVLALVIVAAFSILALRSPKKQLAA